MGDDIFADLAGGGADDGPLSNATSAASASVCVLVVPEKAPWGRALHAEEAAYLKSAHIPQAIFESVNLDTGETIFENEMEFRRAMDSLVPVNIDAALTWCGERVGAVYEAHRDEIEAAHIGEVPQAPGADAVQPRARMPHTTGRQGRGS
ncbi:hypothetical protein ABID58_000686 [Bradyrhizobium sp. S3.2.6]|uniref:hypothetical protein n=1 Tax=Bradyrhizobium sp. S3.2.6 TaxID=3156428 RepID=UPI00339AAF6A